MIDLSRVADNALTIVILIGFGYWFYLSSKGDKVNNFKDKFSKFWGKND